MFGLLETALVFGGIVVVLRVAPLVVVTWRLATQEWRTPTQTPVSWDRVPAAYRTLLEPTHAELEALGFKDVQWFENTPAVGVADPKTFSFSMKHSEHPIFARLSSDNPFDTQMPVAVRLRTWLMDGRSLVTHDFTLDWEVPEPRVEGEDVRAFDLAEQLRVHLSRIAGEPARDLAPEQLATFQDEDAEQTWRDWVDGGQLVQRHEAYGMSWSHAGQMARMTLRGMATRVRALRDKPSQLVPAEALLNFVQRTQRGQKKRSIAFKLMFYVLSFVALVLSFAWLLSWQTGAILAVVIAFHELGHFAAMRLLGRRDARVFLIPFAGGATVARPDAEASLAARLFIYLAGPVPGLIAAASLFPYRHVHELVSEFIAFLAVVNFLNLLPILPLDGGRVVEALASQATPWVRPVFALGSAGLLLVCGIAAGDVLLLILGVLVALGSRAEFRNARFESAVRHTGGDDDALARTVCGSGLPAAGKLALFRTLHGRLHQRPSSPSAVVLGGAIYVGIGVLSVGVTVLALLST